MIEKLAQMTLDACVRSALSFGVSLAFGAAAYAAPPLVLKPGTPIYLSDAAPVPLKRAVQDLQRDLQKTLGAPSAVVRTLPKRGEACIVILGPGEQPDLRNSEPRGFEAHAVFVASSQKDGRVILQGEDARGTLYAIYTFSERVLGVPPLWFWSSWEPVRRSSVEVPSDLRLVFQPASVKWRAWFPNDEDLLTPWRARSQENFEAFLETMLRLKYNTREGGLMDTGSFDTPYSVGRDALLVRDRGLVFTGHHVNIFGGNYRNWDVYWRKIRHTEPPKLSVKNLDGLLDFWRYHIESGLKSGIPTIWQLGFRGSGDIPFWQTFADAPETDAERAALIERVIGMQVKLLKETTGESAPAMRATLYNENSDFVAAGLMKPPAEPSLIWVFVAARRDHYPAPDVRNVKVPPNSPVGYYLNFQFTSSGAHLASAEGPWKMEQNYRMVRDLTSRPLTFSVVNAGNIREFLLELSANAAMMWDFDGFDATRYVQRFCTQYFGTQGPEVASLYQRFYDSYWEQKKADLPGFHRQYVFQDMRYARALEQLLPLIGKPFVPNPLEDRGLDKGGRYYRIVPADSGVDTQLQAIAKGTQRSVEKLELLVRDGSVVLKKLSPAERTFFNDHLYVQAKFMLELNRTLHSVALALGERESAESVRGHLTEARTAFGRLRKVLPEAEHGRFSGWYGGDRLFGVARLSELIDKAIAGAAGPPR